MINEEASNQKKSAAGGTGDMIPVASGALEFVRSSSDKKKKRSALISKMSDLDAGLGKTGTKFDEIDLEKGNTAMSLSATLESASKIDEEDSSGQIRNCQGTQENLPVRQRCCDHPRLKELYTSADWWSVWIGLASFCGAIGLVFAIPYEMGSTRARYLVPQPMKWAKNPLDAWDAYGAVGSLILLASIDILYLLSCKVMGKLKKEPNLASKYALGFEVMAVLATISFWAGQNEWCAGHGFSYAVFAILLGMAVGNSPLMKCWDWLKFASKDGEFFIKCSLVLLAVRYDTLLEVGAPGVIVAWVGSPLAVISGFMIGNRLFLITDKLALLVAVGASWCGASAISAIASIVSATSEEVSLSISVVAFFTLLFTFIQPYIAIGTGMSDQVAGAWIGASVDQTGNVVAAAAIVSDEAAGVASIVKMVLNAGLGIFASLVACWWNYRKSSEEEKTPFSPLLLWDKFPKFVLGFLLTSGILTGMSQALNGTAEGEALPRAVSSLNKWLFAIAFVGIGLTTNVKKLWQGARTSGIIQGYLITNTIDIMLALGLSFLLF